MSDTIKLAVAGLGTVGVGAIELLDKQIRFAHGEVRQAYRNSGRWRARQIKGSGCQSLKIRVVR